MRGKMQVDSRWMLKSDREILDRERAVIRATHRAFNLQNYHISLAIARSKILSFTSDYGFLGSLVVVSRPTRINRAINSLFIGTSY